MTFSNAADDPSLGLAASHPLQAMPVQFTGAAGGYFRVWLVNLLLTILTLGIWSAWAKVRTTRWFLRHTQVNGHAFDYHATGGQILMGRLIALGVMLVYTGLSLLSPVVEWLMFIVLVFALPWAINAGLRFHAGMTSWSNVRFGFCGRYGGALLAFLLMPMAVMLSFGLLAPICSRMSARYVAKGHRYGDAAFAAEPRLRALYAALGRSMLLFVAAFLLCLIWAFLAGLVPTSLSELGEEGDASGYTHHVTIIVDIWPCLLFGYGSLFIAGLYYRACARNEILNHTTLAGGHRLESRLWPIGYIWIVVSGWMLTGASLTLAYPWARVREYRYLMRSVTLLAAPGLDELLSRPQHPSGSFGGEFSQLEGFAGAAVI
jgi:uncharacterized membrane protein YjgN (DUF898 family)